MCVQPLIIKNKTVGKGANVFTTPVPCGKCPECVKSKIQSWSIRIDKELERSKRPLFITLTYNDENLPISNKGHPTLNKRDVQLFMKRLRKQHAKVSDDKLVYYACGEYGSKRGRPHYHMLLLNLHHSIEIDNSWQLGFTYTLPALSASVQYVLKYMSKQRDKKTDIKQREFSLMSKGIGSNYLTPQMVKYHQDNLSNCYYTKKGGYKVSLPKYYKEKIYDETLRPRVTKILQARAEQKEVQTLKYLLKKSQNPELLLQIRKQHITFDKRNNEVL